MRIGIAGYGLAGRLLAWRLLRAGHDVTVFDQDQSGQQAAAHIAAAMLAPYSETVGTGHPLIGPGLHSIALWRTWLNELLDDSGIHVSCLMNGSLIVAHSLDDKELQWFQQRLLAAPEMESADCVDLDRAELLSLEPELTNFDRGLYLPREACLDNRTLLRALAEAVTKLGGSLRTGRISELSPKRLTVSDVVHTFDIVCDCRGLGAKPQFSGLRGVRGELLWLRAPEVKLTRPVRLMHPRYQLYIAPRPNNVYVIGATELESESMAPVSVRSQLELLSALYSLHEGFGEASVLEARSHCRPAFSDNLPRLHVEPGLLALNGLYRHGYLVGPVLVESALKALQGEYVEFPVRKPAQDDYLHRDRRVLAETLS